LFPAFIAWGLISKARIAFTQKLNTHKTIHWAITFSLYLGIMLILWIDFQIMWIGYGHFIQSIYTFLGVAIVVMSLWPTHWKPQ
jgi:large-conductance mechanosensitive channel